MSMRFSLMFFASDGAESATNIYSFLMNACRLADSEGLLAVWLPERHFHRFGGAFPNPAVVGAAVAAVTKRLRIRAGSVILPLNEPLRVAEEWAVVDNLSGGRVDLGFGQGWNPNDFVLMPHAFADRLATLHKEIGAISAMWAGIPQTRRNGLGGEVNVVTFPRPIQETFGLWLTCSGSVDRFEEAGTIGANILTALLFQDVAELAGKIERYQDAREKAGHDGPGQVTLMLHTYVGESRDDVRSAVRQPLMQYLRDSTDLWKQQYPAFDDLSDQDRSRVIEFAFEKYLRSHSMCGTPEQCEQRAEALYAIGVTEVACLVDFGVNADAALASISRIAALQGGLSDEADARLDIEVLSC
jgi:natural product biosynthesis luciferase-like monooxygenase protein